MSLVGRLLGARRAVLWSGVGLLGVALLVAFFRYRDRPVAWTPPALVLPEPNGFDLLVEAAGELPRRTELHPELAALWRDGAGLAEFAAHGEAKQSIAAACAPAFQGARAALAHPIVIPPGAGAPRLADLHRQMLLCGAPSRANGGDWDAAAGTALDALAIAVACGQWDTSRWRLASRRSALVLAVIVPELDAGSARAAARRVERLLAELPDFGTVWERQQAGYLGRLTRLMERRPHWRHYLLDVDLPDGDTFLLGQQLEESVKQLARVELLTREQVIDEYLRYFDRCARHVGEPHDPRGTPIPMPFEEYGGRQRAMFENSRFDHLMTRAALGQLAVALALQAWRAEHGDPPPGLSALVPEYLSEVPADPFTPRRTLGYRPGRQPVVYSVGPDGEDDGGRPVREYLREEPHRAQVQVDSSGDFVLGANW